MTRRAVCFTWDGDHAYPGDTDDTTWNGFLNVRCTPETLAQIQADFRADNAAARLRGSLVEDLEDDDWPRPGHDGMVDLGWGFATVEYIPERFAEPS